MDNTLELLNTVGILKKMKRAGWIFSNVPDPESIAEHSFRAAIMALLFAEKCGVDKARCVAMSLTHDLCESKTGDITPHDMISEEETLRKERKAMKDICKHEGKELLTLWEEYAERKTPEALFVHQIQNLEMLVQALEYEKQYGDKLEEFWHYVDIRIKHPELRKLFDSIVEQREKLHAKE